MHHGSETYFVIGEGVLGDALGGREAEVDGRTTALSDAAADVPQFRFSRLGPKGAGKQLGRANRLKIAEAMTVANVTPGVIPAGYTYFGQFLDHDLTFDKSVLMEGVDIAPATLKQFRSPSLDLDSLYGNGPQDAGSAQLYEADGIHLKSGAAVGGPPDPTCRATAPAWRRSGMSATTRTWRSRSSTPLSSAFTIASSTRLSTECRRRSGSGRGGRS